MKPTTRAFVMGVAVGVIVHYVYTNNVQQGQP